MVNEVASGLACKKPDAFKHLNRRRNFENYTYRSAQSHYYPLDTLLYISRLDLEVKIKHIVYIISSVRCIHFQMHARV
jgi:hypothetical protein